MNINHPHHHHEHDRLTQLLLDRALRGLESDESAELAALLADNPSVDLQDDPGGFEQTAAVAAIAMVGEAESMPASLRQRLHATSESWLRDDGAGFPAGNAAPMRVNAVMLWGGWLAAAAGLALALLAWLPRLSGEAGTSPAELRTQLIARQPADLVQWNWTATDDPSAKGLTGDVVWSDAEQKGYMRFNGLARNDPTREQYQLWIFDKNRKTEYPVDGGVFDVTADGEVIIPIDPKLRVFDANMFAVTVEKPGGVARSDRERIPALAKPPE